MSLLTLDRLARFGGFATIPIRIFLGVFLVYMTKDNLRGFPMPETAARLSVYAQFVGGMLILVGALTRWAALVLAVIFIIAIVGVHRALPFRALLEPCAMLACALALFIGGAGRWSVDSWLITRRARRRIAP